VADEVHTAEARVQAAARHSVVDRARGEAHREELASFHVALLATRQLRDRGVAWQGNSTNPVVAGTLAELTLYSGVKSTNVAGGEGLAEFPC